MSAVPLLTERMLEDLRARWTEQEAPISVDLQAGLSEAEISAETQRLGLTLPIEARTWWAWHNGTTRPVTSHAIGLDLVYLTLQAAVTRCQREREGATTAVEEGLDPEDAWQHVWFPLAGGGDGAVMACDCSVEDGAPTPIRYVHWDKAGSGSFIPVAPSLGTVVSWWIEAIDAGAWHFDKLQERWAADPARLPDPAMERTGLV